MTELNGFLVRKYQTLAGKMQELELRQGIIFHHHGFCFLCYYPSPGALRSIRTSPSPPPRFNSCLYPPFMKRPPLLIVYLLLVNRWWLIRLDSQSTLLREPGSNIRHRDNLVRMPNFLPAHTHGIPRDPKERSRTRHRGIIVSVPLRVAAVRDICKGTGYETTEGLVIGVCFRVEPFADEVGLPSRRSWEMFLGGGSGSRVAVAGHALCRADVGTFYICHSIMRMTVLERK